MFSAGLTRSARLPISVCIGDNKGKDYASLLRETRARESDLFSCIATENLQPGDHFHHHEETIRCLRLILEFKEAITLLFGKRWFLARWKLPLRTVSVITVSISTDPVWGETHRDNHTGCGL